MEIEKEFCIFVAKIITDEQLLELNRFNKNLNDNSIFIKQEMRDNKETFVNLNKYGIPNKIKTGINEQKINSIEEIQEEFNKDIKEKCSSKFFIIEMKEYDKIIDKFYSIANNKSSVLEFPIVNEFKILSIVVAASINATDAYIRENCDEIYKQFTKNL